MLPSRNTLIGLAAGGSLALMLGALGFQHLGDLAPCKMCIWQRYPHVIAVVIGVLAIAIRGPLMPMLGMLAALTTSLFGAFHAGVEQGWWEGPTTCSSASGAGLSEDEFFNSIINAQVIRCDEIPWQMMGLSLAGWNAVISLGLALLWYLALRRSCPLRPAGPSVVPCAISNPATTPAPTSTAPMSRASFRPAGS